MKNLFQFAEKTLLDFTQAIINFNLNTKPRVHHKKNTL